MLEKETNGRWKMNTRDRPKLKGSRERERVKWKMVKLNLLPGEFFGAVKSEIGMGGFFHDETGQ